MPDQEGIIMPTDAEIDAALEAVVTAARAHRALLKAGERTSEQDLYRAYVALNNATVRYDDLLNATYDEVTPWDVEYIEPAAEEFVEVINGAEAMRAPSSEPEPPVKEGSVTISVRQRRDYQVPDVAELRELAAEVRRQTWADHDPSYARTPVTHLGDAVYELILAGDGSLAALDAYPQLIPGNGVLIINMVSEPLSFADTDAEDTEQDEPFRVAPTDALLYRMDEETVEEPV